MPKEEHSKEKGCRQSPEDFYKINKNSDCTLCGCCASECNKLSGNLNDFLEPFVFTKARKFVADSRDAHPRERVIAAIKHGAWKCQHCQECVTKCPKGLAPAEDISRLREEAIAQGMVGHKGVRHAKAFLDDIARTGRLNEGMMAVKTEGLIKSLGNVPLAFRLMRKGKLSLAQMFPKPLKEVGEVRHIIKAVKETEKARKVAGEQRDRDAKEQVMSREAAK